MRRRYRKLRRKNNKRIMRNTIIVMVVLTLGFATGYSAFQTVININAKGNIKQMDFYVSSSGSDTEGNGTKTNPYATIQKAYNSIGKKGTIYLMDNITVYSTIVFDSDKNITLDSFKENTNNENEIINSLIKNDSLTTYMLLIDRGDITFKNVIIDGNNVTSSYPPIVLRSYSPILTMEKNSSIINGISNSSCGGAIRLNDNSNSTFILNGGTISNNSSPCGGAIHIPPNTSFVMNDGEVSNNSSTGHGGALFVSGNFTMNGGMIKNNSAVNNGSMYVGSVAVYTYNLGIICENTPTNEYETQETCPN